MRVVVTGAAGFIGSHVAEAMADAGHEVLAVDCLTRAACPDAARRNWAELATRCPAGAAPGTGGITLAELDLAADDLTGLADTDAVVHLAGRPGIRTSWGTGEPAVRRDNVHATRRLLAACAGRPAGGRPRVVVASSSSVYGSAARPCTEDEPPRPESPYARSKLAVEQLAGEAAGHGVPTVVLRYFSVYGPRQRPDMAFHRFIEAALRGADAPVFGDGGQQRAFTYVTDVVDATVRAATIPLPPATVVNVGHPETVPVRQAIAGITAHLGTPVRVEHRAPVPGDATRTWAVSTRAGELLGWFPRTGLDEGLAGQIAWHREVPGPRGA